MVPTTRPDWPRTGRRSHPPVPQWKPSRERHTKLRSKGQILSVGTGLAPVRNARGDRGKPSPYVIPLLNGDWYQHHQLGLNHPLYWKERSTILNGQGGCMPTEHETEQQGKTGYSLLRVKEATKARGFPTYAGNPRHHSG